MYLGELIKELGVTDEIDKAILAAIVLETIKDNKLCEDVDHEELINVMIDGVTTRYMFDVCTLAASWCNDLTKLFCEKIQYSDVWTKFYPEVIWPYLRRKSPMKGVKLMP